MPFQVGEPVCLANDLKTIIGVVLSPPDETDGRYEVAFVNEPQKRTRYPEYALTPAPRDYTQLYLSQYLKIQSTEEDPIPLPPPKPLTKTRTDLIKEDPFK